MNVKRNESFFAVLTSEEKKKDEISGRKKKSNYVLAKRRNPHVPLKNKSKCSLSVSMYVCFLMEHKMENVNENLFNIRRSYLLKWRESACKQIAQKAF